MSEHSRKQLPALPELATGDIDFAEDSFLVRDGSSGSDMRTRLGSAAGRDVGTGPGQLPRNKDLYRITTKDVAGGADVTLTEAEAQARVLVFTGELTDNINVIVPDKAWLWLVKNDTSGEFDLTVTTSSGAGVLVPQGKEYSVRSDGADVLPMVPMVGSQSDHDEPENKAVLARLDRLWAANVPLGLDDQRVITVGDGGDFSSLTEALAYASKYYPVSDDLNIDDTTGPSHWMEIMLLSGFELQEHIKVSCRNLSWIKLSAEDSTVPIVLSSGAPAFNIQQHAQSPTFNVLFDADDSTGVQQVVRVTRSSQAFFFPGAGVINAPNRALNISGCSSVVARGTIWDGAKGTDAAIRLSSVAWADMRESQLNNVLNAVTAVLVAEGSTGDFSRSVSSGCQRVLRAQDASRLFFMELAVTGTTAFSAVDLRRCAVAEGRNVSIQNAGGPGVQVESGSTMSISGSVKNSGFGGTDLRVLEGGVIAAHGAETTSGSGGPSVGDTNVSSFNMLSSDGVIWA